MKETTNYKLKKIELTDSPPDITVINPNWDAIDAELKKQDDARKTHEDDLEIHQRIVTGMYISTGGIQEINVGFRPKYVKFTAGTGQKATIAEFWENSDYVILHQPDGTHNFLTTLLTSSEITDNGFKENLPGGKQVQYIAIGQEG